MGQKFKNWHNPERMPKKFKKFAEQDSGPNVQRGSRNDRKDRSNKNRNWQQDWDKEP